MRYLSDSRKDFEAKPSERAKTLFLADDEIGKAYCKEVPMYPDGNMRVFANAIIHQDFPS